MARIVFLALAIGALGSAQAREYYVGPGGASGNPGSKEKPFAAIQKAAERLEPGDTCHIAGGIYRETVYMERSGKNGAPIRLVPQPDTGAVTIAGTELVTSKWAVHKGAVYKIRLKCRGMDKKAGPSQVFVDGAMMVEARWPNMRFPQDLWNDEAWARAGKGSRYGKMVDPELAKTGVDWTGGRATLNVAHQFYTWTQPVTRHEAGSDTFEYAKNLTGITHYADKTKPWEDDYYYLSGKLGALDIPGEWYYDRQTGELYLWTLNGTDPGKHTVEVRVRDTGLGMKGCAQVEIRGIRFFASNLSLHDCNSCLIEDCHLEFATRAPRGNGASAAARTEIKGSHNTVRRCSFAYSQMSGLVVHGEYNTIENCLFHDICWDGSLHHVPLRVGGLRKIPFDCTQEELDAAVAKPVSGGSTIRQNTVYNFGNAGICFYGQAHTVELNHVYDGGLSCKDVSLVYTQLPECAGSVVRYNWVHGCHTRRKWGLGIRGDDQTRGLIVHHNGVWDCGRDGIIVKGDFNKVHNNTVFDIGHDGKPGNYVNLNTVAEPKKSWRDQYPLLEAQNTHCEIYNNAALTIVGHNKGTPFPQDARRGNNFCEPGLELKDPARFDFRPKKNSPLVDAGRVIAGYTDGFKGAAPDIGAYEYGGEPWRPGITWNPSERDATRK